MRNNLLPIAKEGFRYLLYLLGTFLLFTILDLEFLSFFIFLAIIAFAFFFRNPERVLPIFQDNSVVSPVDGVVTSIDEINDGEYAYKVTIASSFMDVGVLRVPFTSTVNSYMITRGTRLAHSNPLSEKLNENAEIVFTDNNSNNIKLFHTLKQGFDEITLDVIKEQKFIQGTRYGFSLNGLTTVYLPQNFRLNINVGNEIKSSESLVGYFS